jgi:hypothetical protein
MKILSQLNFESDFTNKCEELEMCKKEFETTQIELNSKYIWSLLNIFPMFAIPNSGIEIL